MTTLHIKGDADLKIRIFGRTLYDKDTPFDVSVPLAESGSYSHTFGPATIQVGVDGDTVSLAGLIEGFPVFHESFSLSEYDGVIPFDFRAVGDEAKGTITLLEAA